MDIEDLKKEIINTKKKILDGVSKENLAYYLERLLVLESIISSYYRIECEESKKNFLKDISENNE